MAVFRTSFASSRLNRWSNINVVLPVDSFDQAASFEPSLKTLLLLPGFRGNQDDWMECGRIHTLTKKYPLALIMPAGENSFYADATGYSYSDYVRELIEFSRRAFRLTCNREDTYIGGVSMGGFGALRIGGLHHDLFSKIFTFSGAFILDNLVGKQPGWRDQITDYETYVRAFGDLNHVKGTANDPLWCMDQAILAGEAPAVYQVCGKQDYLLEENRAMAQELEKRGVRHEYHEPEGGHGWTEWLTMIEPAVQWLLE